jgi:hypothetical protein
METVEAEKMEWMVDVEKKETDDGPPAQFNARYESRLDPLEFKDFFRVLV